MDEKKEFNNEYENSEIKDNSFVEAEEAFGTVVEESKGEEEPRVYYSEPEFYNTNREFPPYSSERKTDFNTSGVDYSSHSHEESEYSDEDENHEKFFNTHIKKRVKKHVPAYAMIIAILLTAVVSLGAAVGYMNVQENSGETAVIEQKSDKDTNKVKTQGSGRTTGGAVVATATAGREGMPLLTTPEIVDKVGPAVVGVINTANTTNRGFFYDIFGGGEAEQSSGSGVIISSDGYIVTNNHVIENAHEITVILNTGDEYKATLIGADSKTDLAVLKIEAEGLVFAQMGKSSELRVGDTAIAIGNPLGQEFAGTTTQGIISGLNRSITIDDKQLTLIQTDAAINPGNSGGALVDAYGQLIGINTAKISSQTLEGLGFAIPIDVAKPIISDLIDNGYVTGRPIIGIGGRTVTEEDAEAYDLKVGIYVISMTPNSPAYMAGIKIGDIIVECNSKAVKTIDELNTIKNQHKPGDELKLKIYRQGKYKDITVVLGEELPTN